MLHEYHVIYSVRYYPRFHVTVVGLGTYYSLIRGHYCIRVSLLNCVAKMDTFYSPVVINKLSILTLDAKIK
jgi:hypothetical protein